jgi:hypothetical protein
VFAGLVGEFVVVGWGFVDMGWELLADKDFVEWVLVG